MKNKDIHKLNSLRAILAIVGYSALFVGAIVLACGLFILGGVLMGAMLTTWVATLTLTVKIQAYLEKTQTWHYKGEFPKLEDYGFTYKGNVYVRQIPRGNNTYAVYINTTDEREIYCERNGADILDFKFAISDLIRDGLVTVEREVL